MDKKEYITNQFRKTFGKKYENYCLTRIYSLVGRDDLQIITQQLFKRKNTIAYADLYLPQINMWIEVNEAFHNRQVVEDKLRRYEIERYNKPNKKEIKKYNALDELVFQISDPYVINISSKTTLDEINRQIDEIVMIINKKIKNMGNLYIPWKEVYTDPKKQYEKGYISVSDNTKFRILKDICVMFNLEKFNVMHGYIKINENTYIWSPIVKISGIECDKNNWENEISDDGMIIYERNKEGKGLGDLEKLSNETRFVFVKLRDNTGNICRKFRGVFRLDVDQSINKNIRIWKKVSDNIDLKQFVR